MQPPAFACPSLSAAPQRLYRGRWCLFPGLFLGKLRHKGGKQLAPELRSGCGCRSWSGSGSGSPKSRGGTSGLTISPLFLWPWRGPCILCGCHCGRAGMLGAIVIPTVHPLPGMLEGLWATRDPRAADLTRAHPPSHQSPWDLVFFAVFSPYPNAGVSSGICYLIAPFCLLPLPYPASALILQHQLCLLPPEEQIR